MNTHRDISRSKRIAFTGVMLLLPVLFFLLLEGGLRVFGYGADTRLFVERELHERAYYAVNPDVVKRYFGMEGFASYTSRDLFAKQKGPGTYRIFCLGASTTIGFPYMFNASYSSILRTMLEAKFPDKHFEVVNVGITAVNSFTVADLTKEVVRYEPDLLIVYSGHNEFYGALGVASAEGVGRNYNMIRFRMWLRNLRTAELLANVIGTVSGRDASVPDDSAETLMEQMAREQEIARGSDLYRLAVQHYERNLNTIARTAADAGVPLMIGTLVSNLKDQPPFVSLHGVHEDAPEFDVWRGHFEGGRSALAEGDYPAAIDSFEAAAEADPMHAETQFLLGRALEAAGNPDGARAAFERARDLDGLRFRASGDFNDVLRAVTIEHGLQLIEMEPVFDEEVARVRIEYLVRRWPFRTVPEPFDYRPQTRMQDLVWEYLQGRTSWRLANLELARFYEEEEDWPSAERLYYALSVAFPQEPYYANATGNMQARQGKVAEAAESFRRALAYRESSDLHAKVGFAYFELGRLDDATRHLARASEMEAVRPEMPLPQRAHLDFVLAQAWLRTGRRDQAARQLERLQQYAAEAPFTRALARELAQDDTES